jgi:peptidoglycan/LPS O-acetylase OafA/YrhL
MTPGAPALVRQTGREGAGSVKYHALDVLRGVAALWVFAFHLHIGYAIVGLNPIVEAVFRRGFLGVPMFFVISGYCLMASARSAARRGESARGFLYRRWLRIYPPFWCSIAVLVALPFLIEAISSLKTRNYVIPATSFPTSASEWVGILTMTQIFRSHGQDLHEAFASINSVYWTLAIEVQFYVIVALALASGKLLWSVTALSGLVALIPAAYTCGLFLPYWPMFAFGVILYWLLEHGWTPDLLFGRNARAILALLLGLIVLGCWTIFVCTDFATTGPDSPSLGLFSFAVVFAVLLWLGHPLDQAAASFLSPRGARPAWPLRVLLITGAMSYSIYLLHTKLCYLVMQFVRQVDQPGTVLFFAACFVGTVILCYPFYRICEKPFIRSQVAAPAPAVKEAEVAVLGQPVLHPAPADVSL